METKPGTTEKVRLPRKISRIIKVAGNILCVLLILIAIIMVFFAVQNRVAGGPPMIAGYHMYIVMSGSMAPTFDMGSMVFVKPVEPQLIEENDIITFRGLGDSTRLTTHRVVEISGNGQDLEFITKGDANEAKDPNPIPAGNLVGKVALAVPYLGYLVRFSQTRQGVLVLVLIPGILFIINESFNLFGNISRLRKEKKEPALSEQTAGKGEGD